MFTVGEFSRIAQVSKRLLRYYDEIGLLPPRHIDPSTGYRFYSAGQLPQLNRILALKDLGLSLEQIQRLARDEVSMEEMQGMLLLKKAEELLTLGEKKRGARMLETVIQQYADTPVRYEAYLALGRHYLDEHEPDVLAAKP